MRVRPMAVAATALVAVAVGSGTAGAAQRAGVPRIVRAMTPKGYKVVTVSKPLGVAAMAPGTTHATCPKNTVAVGGGQDNSSASSLVDMSSSYPSGREWISTVDNGSASSTNVTAWAVCITKPSKFKIVKATVSNASQSQTAGDATCPSGTVVLGGGAKTTSTVQQALNSTKPFGTTAWLVYVNNRDTAAHNYTAYAVCGAKPAGYADVDSASIPSPGSTQTAGNVTCPSSGVPLSGGVFSSSSDLYTDVNQTTPETPHQWATTMDNVSSTPTSFNVWAVCAT
jgi:hypothetical protein